MNKSKAWTIYCHTHIESGRRYVGLTSQTWQARWKTHCYVAKKSSGGRWHFPNAIRKYGPEAFSHEVLEVCLTLELANLAEEKWISHFDTRNPEMGFNLAKGGSHAFHPIRKNPWDDPEYRARQLPRLASLSKDPLVRAASKASLNTPEVKAKISAAVKESLKSPDVLAKK